MANWAPAVSPTSPVAHPLGAGPARSPALVQELVGAEQGQRKMLGYAVKHRRKNCWLFFLLAEGLLGSSMPPGSWCFTGPWIPAPTRAPASAVSLPPRAAAAFGRLPDSSRLHAQPDFKNKQAPPLPRDARRASASSRLPRLGTLLEGPRRDVRAVTPRSRRRSLGAPRACGVRLRIALPPCVSPPVLRCSVRIALL